MKIQKFEKQAGERHQTMRELAIRVATEWVRAHGHEYPNPADRGRRAAHVYLAAKKALPQEADPHDDSDKGLDAARSELLKAACPAGKANAVVVDLQPINPRGDLK